MTTAPLLEVNGVTLQYRTPSYLITATYRVDFKVFQGDRFILLGPFIARSGISAAKARARIHHSPVLLEQ